MKYVMDKEKEMRKYEDFSLDYRKISTAVFEYLLKRGYKPNRKKGVKSDWRGYYWCEVEKEKGK